ncbi:MAG: outer membrane beta-barrel protein [Planctomycetota bacterium]|jgi:hypothetical protein
MKRETAPVKARNMRKIRLLGFVLMVVGLSGSTAFALDPMGPPAAGLKQGQFKAGVDYSHSEMDLELSEGTWIEYIDGVFWDSGEAVPFTLKELKINRTYASFGYGAGDNCEVFLRVGGTNAKFGDSLWEDAERYDSSTDFAIGGGVKVTFLEAGDLKLGGLFQANWAEYDGILDATHWAAPDFVEIDIAEIQIAVGATYDLADNFSIYGGPFLHFVSGDLDDIFSEVDGGGGLLTSEYVWDIDEDSTFGGYIGAQFELGENCSFNIEYQSTAAAEALGASLTLKF